MRMISRCNIGDIVISDHAIVVLDVSVKGFLRPARSWRFNNLLLKDDTFLSHFNSEFKIFLSINSDYTNNPSLLWETTNAYVRGLIISYSTTKKRKQSEKQKHLEIELNTATSRYLNDPSQVLLEKNKCYTDLSKFFINSSVSSKNTIFKAKIIRVGQ